MQELLSHSIKFISENNIDALGIGVIDFKNNSFNSFELNQLEPDYLVDKPKIYFDLASVSKPLTNGIGFLEHEKEISNEMNLVLNHKGSLPAWGLLPKNGWKEIILDYKIKEDITLYSDYSALRFMLEYNKKFDKTLHQTAQKYWDKEVLFWKDLTLENECLQNGFRNGMANLGVVHDPNAYTINDYVSHAGLFGTINGVCQTLLNLNTNFNLVSSMDKKLSSEHTRFVAGWDTVEDPQNTFAGLGCSDRTFGHLGFTGTSVWIDSVKELGHVILTNATKFYWYDKLALNKFRKEIGQLVWQKN